MRTARVQRASEQHGGPGVSTARNFKHGRTSPSDASHATHTQYTQYRNLAACTEITVRVVSSTTVRVVRRATCTLRNIAKQLRARNFGTPSAAEICPEISCVLDFKVDF